MGKYKISYNIETPDGRNFGLGYDFKLPAEPFTEEDLRPALVYFARGIERFFRDKMYLDGLK
jgi:hypothetical protein